MRLKRLLLIIPFVGAAFTGCIKEDRSGCDPEDNNLEFIFEYTTDATIEFAGLIKSVDLLLFDANSRFMEHRRSGESELRAYQGMRFSVSPGTYYAVAWGNVGNSSGFSDFTTVTKLFSECFVQITEGVTEGGDPVYYAPHKDKPYARSQPATTRSEPTLYEVNVLSGQTTVKRLDFVRAHRTINVWISGFERSSFGESTQPVVTGKNLWSRYDFYFNLPSLRRDYRKQTINEVISGEIYSTVTFYSALGTLDDESNIEVHRTSDNQLSYTLNLKQFVLDNNITNTEQIDILITFQSDLGVSVSVPQWTEKPVQPGTK